MQILIIILILVLVVGFATVLYFVNKKLSDLNPTGKQDAAFGMLNQNVQALRERVDNVNEQLDKKMQHSHVTIQEQFKQTSKIIQDVTEKLTTLDHTNKQVLDFSSQLQNLQNILKNPKQRGVLGEYWLETLLSNVLQPENYKMQYPMGLDEKTDKQLIADAVIFIRNMVIPIDAKFSLENFNRMMEESDPTKRAVLENEFKKDVKVRIDETSKYIRPETNTTNFAFMFVPAEGVYYNLLNAEVGSGVNSNNLIEYALKKHVMIVSPTSFYAYLQTVLLGLRELRLEESTTAMIKHVAELGKHFVAYADYHERLGKNLGTVVTQYNLSSNELKKVHKDVSKITDGGVAALPELVDAEKPTLIGQ